MKKKFKYLKIKRSFKKVPFNKKYLDEIFDLYEPLFLPIDKIAPLLTHDELKLLCISPDDSYDDE